MTAWAVPGAECVCIGTPTPDGWVDPSGKVVPGLGPAKGEKCLITGTVIPPPPAPQLLCLQLQGYDGWALVDWPDGSRREARMAHWVGYFAPIVKRTQEQDLAIFAPLLTVRDLERAD
jgi:hypothetical protein